MIYSNIGIYKYGRECETVQCQISRIERPKTISNIIGIRKNAIELHDYLKVPDVLYELIKLFHESYYNTNLNVEIFSEEFYKVVGCLNSGIIPLELDFLVVDEILDDIEEILRGEL